VQLEKRELKDKHGTARRENEDNMMDLKKKVESQIFYLILLVPQ
jgi:hypothetical protein